MDSTATRPKTRDLVTACLILVAGATAMLLYHEARTNGEFSRLLYNDESTYYLPAAEAIRAEGFSWFFTDRSLWTGPLNPIWVALWGARIALAKLANVALFAVAGLAVWDMARRFFNVRAAVIAVALYAVYPPFYRFTPTLLTEPLFVSLIVFAMWFATVQGRYEMRAAAASGALLGLATLARPTLQLFPVFLLAGFALWKLVATRTGVAVAVDTKKVLLVVAGFAVLVGPYAIKNVVSLDKMGIANGAGAVLYLGNDLRTHGYEPIDSALRFNTKEISTPYTHLDTEGDRRLLEAGLDLIMENPIEVALLQPSKALRLLFGSPEHYFRPNEDAIEFFQARSWVARFNLWDLILTPMLVTMGLLGLAAIPTSSFAKLMIGSLVAYLILLNTALFPIPRMVLAAFPFFIVFAAGAFTVLSRRLLVSGLVVAIFVALFIALKGLFATPGIVSERYVEYFDPIAAVATDRWLATNDLIEQSTGVVTSIGPDPFVVFDVEDFEASLNQIIFLTIRYPGDSTDEPIRAQVFWRTDEMGFSEERSEFFDLYSNESPITYAVSPSFRRPWSGVISQIRVDFPDFEPNVTYELERIEVRK